MDNLIEEIKEINKDNDIFGTYQKSKSICDFLELDSNKEMINLIEIMDLGEVGKVV